PDGSLVLTGEEAAHGFPPIASLGGCASLGFQLLHGGALLGRQGPNVCDVIGPPGPPASRPLGLLEEPVFVIEDAGEAVVVVEDKIEVLERVDYSWSRGHRE